MAFTGGWLRVNVAIRLAIKTMNMITPLRFAARAGTLRLPIGTSGSSILSAGLGRTCPGPQHVTLDLAGCGLGQAVHELDPARILPRAHGALHVHLELLVER